MATSCPISWWWAWWCSSSTPRCADERTESRPSGTSTTSNRTHAHTFSLPSFTHTHTHTTTFSRERAKATLLTNVPTHTVDRAPLFRLHRYHRSGTANSRSSFPPSPASSRPPSSLVLSFSLLPRRVYLFLCTPLCLACTITQQQHGSLLLLLPPDLFRSVHPNFVARMEEEEQAKEEESQVADGT